MLQEEMELITVLAQVFDLEEMDKVAEYKGQPWTTEFGNFLIELATKYNDALLVVEITT